LQVPKQSAMITSSHLAASPRSQVNQPDAWQQTQYATRLSSAATSPSRQARCRLLGMSPGQSCVRCHHRKAWTSCSHVPPRHSVCSQGLTFKRQVGASSPSVTNGSTQALVLSTPCKIVPRRDGALSQLTSSVYSAGQSQPTCTVHRPSAGSGSTWRQSACTTAWPDLQLESRDGSHKQWHGGGVQGGGTQAVYHPAHHSGTPQHTAWAHRCNGPSHSEHSAHRSNCLHHGCVGGSMGTHLQAWCLDGPLIWQLFTSFLPTPALECPGATPG